MCTKFWLQSLKGRRHFEDEDERIILKWILGLCCGGYWIHLVQDKVQLHGLVNMVMNLQVP
jgi:hypothetical protein